MLFVFACCMHAYVIDLLTFRKNDPTFDFIHYLSKTTSNLLVFFDDFVRYVPLLLHTRSVPACEVYGFSASTPTDPSVEPSPTTMNYQQLHQYQCMFLTICSSCGTGITVRPSKWSFLHQFTSSSLKRAQRSPYQAKNNQL